MISTDYGLEAKLEISNGEKDDKGQDMISVTFTVKEKLARDKEFNNYSYLHLDEDGIVIIASAHNYDDEKIYYEEDGKETWAIILDTEIYIEPEFLTECLKAYARAMKNVNSWIKIPNHDATEKSFLSAIKQISL